MTDQKLVDELEKALRDEAYDGGFGYMGDEQFTAYVRTLAVTAAKVVEEALTPTDDEREALAAMIGYELYAEQMSKAIGGRPSRSAFDTLGEVWRESWLEATRPIADVILTAGFHRTEVPEPPTREAWRDSIVDERCQQPPKGYTADHDREHGLDHLLEWAQEYARIGEPLKSAALIEAARDLHRTSEVPEPSAEGYPDAEYDARLGDGDRDDPEPQGEPSDATVQNALDAAHAYYSALGEEVESTPEDFEAMRAALRAAEGVR